MMEIRHEGRSAISLENLVVCLISHSEVLMTSQRRKTTRSTTTSTSCLYRLLRPLLFFLLVLSLCILVMSSPASSLSLAPSICLYPSTDGTFCFILILVSYPSISSSRLVSLEKREHIHKPANRHTRTHS